MTTNASRTNILVGAFEYLESGTKLKKLADVESSTPPKNEYSCVSPKNLILRNLAGNEVIDDACETCF